jgi:hypothetical protein
MCVKALLRGVSCLFIIIACIGSSTALHAQLPKLVVRFKNKAGTSGTLQNPSTYLSNKAIQRRTRYNISIDSTDLPVTQRYIDSVLAQGNVQLLSSSKWLNAILIRCTDAATVQRINNLPFVQSSTDIGLRPAPSTQVSRFWMSKFEGEGYPTPQVLTANRTENTTGNYYNYFKANAQVRIHQGEYLHNKGFRGDGIVIAVQDAGFDRYLTIRAFDSARIENRILGVRDFVDFDNSVNEDDSHGRQCLSNMAANWPGEMVGTSPKASFWLLRTENANSEYPIEEFNWVVGAEFADSTGADMISSSLGYIDFDDARFNYSYSNFYNNTAMVTQGASLAAKKGMIVMNSAGNSGAQTWRYIGFPADADSVCAVAAMDTLGVIASFSSWGYPGKIKPNITSVGRNTIVAGTTTAVTNNGTSFSNPNIAGLIACLWQAFPEFNNMAILNAVYRSSDRYNTPNDRFGYGIPNFRKAWQILRAQQNQQLYGSTTLWATPNPFNDTIQVRFIAQVDGTASIRIINSNNVVVDSIRGVYEKEELYTLRFNNLSNLPNGQYTIRYSDSLTANSIVLNKLSAALPTTFVAIYAKPAGTTTNIVWKVANDINVASYNIERSNNGRTYTTIGNIRSTPSNLTTTYQWNDAAATQTTYYRIKAIGNDQSFKYSPVVIFNPTVTALDYTVYPNPVQQTLQVQFNQPLNDNLAVYIYNQQGQMVQQVNNLQLHGNNILQLNVQHLPQGSYLIKIQTNHQKLTNSFIKQ